MELRTTVVIVGGGIIGCSIAYNLVRRGCNAVLVERDSVGSGTTGRSVGGIRHFKRDPLEAELSGAGYALHKQLHEELGAPTDFRITGSLAIYSDRGELESAQPAIPALARRGVRLDILEPTDVLRFAPYLYTGDIAGGVYCPDDARSDPYAVTQAYRSAAQRLGAVVLEHTVVKGVDVERGRVTGVETDATRIEAEVVVNAAGAAAGEVGDMVGVRLPVTPSKRQAFLLESTDPTVSQGPVVLEEAQDLHFIPDPYGTIIIRGVPSIGTLDTLVDWGQLEEIIPVICHRAPSLSEARVQKAWAGVRAFSGDGRPILGFVSEPSGFFCAVAWGGVGFAQGPVVGVIAAEMILDGKPLTLDVTALSPSRFGP